MAKIIPIMRAVSEKRFAVSQSAFFQPPVLFVSDFLLFIDATTKMFFGNNMNIMPPAWPG